MSASDPDSNTASPPGFSLLHPVQCASCGAAVATGAVSRAAITQCGGCGKVLDLAAVVSEKPAPSRPTGEFHPRARLPMPQCARVEDRPDRLELRLPNSAGRFIWSLLAAAAAAVLPLIALVAPRTDVGLRLGALAAVLLCAYVMVQAAVNTQFFTVDADGLRLGTGPLPWFNRSEHLRGIRQIFVERNWRAASKYSYAFVWDVIAITRDGKRARLLEDVRDPILALWLEQRLEERLGIPDEAVESEVARPGARK